MIGRLIALLVLLWGLAVAAGGLYVLVKVSSDTTTWSARGGIAGLVLGLILIGVSGGMWRFAGGGRVGASRQTLRGRLGLPYRGQEEE